MSPSVAGSSGESQRVTLRSALHTEPWVPRAYQACGEAGREAGGADGVNEKCRQDLTINLQDLGNREVIPSGINLEK